MLCVKHCLAGLLAAACVAGPVSVAAPVARVSATVARNARVVQTPVGSAASEREEGRAFLHRGKAAEALIHLERARDMFRAAGDRSGEASTLDLLGELYERQGRYDSALENYRAALNLYTALAGKAQPRPSGNLPSQAGATASKVAKGAATASTLTTEESGYNALLMRAKIGNMHYRRDDFQNAQAVYNAMNLPKPDTSALGKVKRSKWAIIGGAADAIQNDDHRVGISTDVLGGLGAFKSQLDYYRKSVPYAAQEIGLGRLDLRVKQFDSARKHFNNVLDVTKGDLPFVGKLGQMQRYNAAARTSLGDVNFAEGRYKEAAKSYEEAFKEAKDDHRLDLMWPAQRGEGRSLWQLAAAEKDSKKASNLRDDALGLYREALKTIETIRAGSIRADESRTTFLATTKDVFDEAVGALAEMAIAEASNSAPSASGEPATTRPLAGKALAYASEALTYSERGRARSLLDMLSETGGEIRGGVPDELQRKKRENLQQQQKIAAMLTGVSLGGDVSKDELENAEKNLSALESDYESIENQIGRADPRYAALTSPHTLTLEEIQRQVLDDQTALLEYSLGEDRSYLFAVTPAGVTVSRLPARADIERQVADFRQQLIPSNVRRSITDLIPNAVDPERGLKLSRQPPVTSEAVSAYAQAAGALYKSAVGPAAPLFKQSRLLVVADGALNYVPFDALVSAEPQRGSDFSTLPYLIKTNETVFAPSASVVAAIRQQHASSSRASGDMLVVADPVFDAADSRARVARQVSPMQPDAQTEGANLSIGSALADLSGEGSAVNANASTRGMALVRLTGTREEAEEIRKLAGASGLRADVWLDTEANASNVESRDLTHYRVLHFATHGLLNAERPQFTGVVLSLVGNRDDADGFLRTDEVFNLQLSSPLVMLSACETGLGRERRGEGVMGLSRAFMYAGAPTVGVTLWSVADKSTSELMTDFYKSLLGRDASATPSSAMRDARRRMIEAK